MPYKDLPDITQKQIEIIELVYKFRFMNRHQIQKIMGHKDYRRINAWLKDLVDKKYLGRIYSHKLLENTKPAIYYLDNHAILWCRYNMGYKYRQDDELGTREVKKFYDDKNASETFRNHCLTLCDVYLQYKQREKDIKCEYQYLTKTELWTYSKTDKDFDEMKQYIPDVFIEKITESKKDVTSTTFCLELFDSHVPRYALEYKVRQYIKLHDEEDWKRYGGLDEAFPQILFILPNQAKLNKLKNYIQELLSEAYDVEDITFMLTTYKKVMEQGISKDIWNTVTEE